MRVITVVLAVIVLAAGGVVGLVGCAPREAPPQMLTQSALAAPPPDSKLVKVRPGMTLVQVVDIVGAPNDQRWYPSGKSWIPWYFGPDRARTAYYYQSEGRVIFSGTGSTMVVHHVEYDPSEDGLK